MPSVTRMVVDATSSKRISGRGWRLRGRDRVRILVVADDHEDAELLSGAFTAEGQCDLDAVVGLQACLDAFDGAHGGAMHLPDLVVVDTKAPDATLTEALRRLKGSGFAGVPVVVLSDLDDQERVQDCYAAHAAAYVVKPISPDGVRETARSVAWFWLGRTELPDPDGTLP